MILLRRKNVILQNKITKINTSVYIYIYIIKKTGKIALPSPTVAPCLHFYRTNWSLEEYVLYIYYGAQDLHSVLLYAFNMHI